MKVVISERAIVSILVETKEKISTETGGLFLGRFLDDTFYVVEAIDPGPDSVFEVAYFEYDVHYVNHLINKISRFYEPQLDLIGLWHRHPGSLDVFSGTDDITNKKYAQLNEYGAISGLVNIDPDFRLTIYKVESPLEYRKIEYEIGEIPSFVCEFKKPFDEILKLKENGKRKVIERNESKSFLKIKKAKQYVLIKKRIKEYIKENNAYLSIDESDMIDVEELFDCIEEDVDYFKDINMDIHMQITENKIAVLKDKDYFEIEFVKYNGDYYFCFDDLFCKYEKGLIKRIVRYG